MAGHLCPTPECQRGHIEDQHRIWAGILRKPFSMARIRHSHSWCSQCNWHHNEVLNCMEQHCEYFECERVSELSSSSS